VRQQQPLSLETPVSHDEGGRLADFVPDPAGDPSATLRELFRERADLVSVLDDLAANERTVLRRRFGLEGDPPRHWKRSAVGSI
jgi:DNA-directed RNA polymerase sigma subunit (sigma70/sigma32)